MTVDTFLEWVDSTHPVPVTLALLGLILEAWRSGWMIALDVQWPAALWQAAVDQTQVGWASFIEGFVVHSWATAQQEYFSAIGHRLLGHIWLAQLIDHLWRVGQHMWEHRNLVLHQGSSIPQFLCEWCHHADKVHVQFELGLGMLDQWYAHWFHGMVDDLLNQPWQFTLPWLWNVVVACECHA